MSETLAPIQSELEPEVITPDFLIPDSDSTWPDDDDFQLLADRRVAIFKHSKILRVDDRNFKLNPMCAKLGYLLAENADVLMSYQRIRDQLWGSWYTSHEQSNRFQVTLSNLRLALGPNLGKQSDGAIKTVRGVGLKALSRLPAHD